MTSSLRDETDSDKADEYYANNVTLETLPAEGQQLLQDYSDIAPQDILPHREKGWAIAHFACIGQIRCHDRRLTSVPYSPAFLSQLGAGANFLDVGCGIGQELRYLAKEGVPLAQLHAFDLEKDLIDLGFELFRDGERMGSRIVQADMLASLATQPHLRAWAGSMDLIQASQMLHVFDYDDMFRAAVTLVGLSRPCPGTLIAGTQIGSRNPGSYFTRCHTLINVTSCMYCP
ncbi:MAG: hypothetical protein Q9162_000276 [Coniocarpon cinnabarinum]